MQLSSRNDDKAAEEAPQGPNQSVVLQEVFGSDLGSEGEDIKAKLMDVPSPVAERNAAYSSSEKKSRLHKSRDARDDPSRRREGNRPYARGKLNDDHDDSPKLSRKTKRVLSDEEDDEFVERERRDSVNNVGKSNFEGWNEDDHNDSHLRKQRKASGSDDEDDNNERRVKSYRKKMILNSDDEDAGRISEEEGDNGEDEDEVQPVKKKRKVYSDEEGSNGKEENLTLSTLRKAPVFDEEEMEEEEMEREEKKMIRSERKSKSSVFDNDESDKERDENGYGSEDSEEEGRGERRRKRAEKEMRKAKGKKKVKLERREEDDNMDDAGAHYAHHDIEGKGGEDDHENRVGSEGEEEEPKPKKPLNAFEKAIEENKAMRRPRRQEIDPAIVEAECVAFLERMMKARDDDIRSYKRGKPALEKLKMLREVELMVMKVSHREQLLDNMLLAIIKAWLDPMPDGALPNVEIRTSLLTILSNLRVDNDWVERLESSQGLGRVVHYLSRNDDHAPNKRMAEKLMMKWARPVYQSNSNFHDLLDEFDKPDEGRRAPKDGVASERRAAMETVKHFKTAQERMQQFKKKNENEGRSQQILATVPRRTPFLFTALAESSASVDEKQLREIRNTKARNKKVNRTMSTLRKANKNRSARAAKPSLNGRR